MKYSKHIFITSALIVSFIINAAPFDSTYVAKPSPTVLLKNANIYDGDGNEFLGHDLLIRSGKIEKLANDIDITSIDGELEVLDLTGMWVTPGIIDIHSHMGVYSAPGVKTSSDGNEATSPVTADVWAEHSVWTQDPQFSLALQGGITTFHVLPGSANLIGGRGTTFKNIQSNTIQGMKFPSAPHSLKMACGENPKRVYGSRKRAPSTRMGNVAGYRKAWIDADKYQKRLNSYETKSNEAKEIVSPPTRDLELETLVGVLNDEILVHNHCYRAEEMAMMIDVAKEFGYKITAFHHAVEAYKIADLLADNNICGALWADWWGFKHEAYDMVQENVAIIDQARNGTGCAIVHSDDAIGIQHLNQEAAKALAAGNRSGFDISKARAIMWITLNPAKAAGISDVTGSLVAGKNADVVIWNKNPFSVYSIAQKVFIDGNLMFDRDNPSSTPVSDFDLGIIKPSSSRTE